MVDISAEILIPLVEQRGVIWDKTLDVYKDKALRSEAWREICCVFNPDFDSMEENDRKDFAKAVSMKWIHIRDSFLRSQKKGKEKKRFAASAKTTRPYIYKNQLSFLSKLYESRTKFESCNERSTRAAGKQFPPTNKKTKTDTLDAKMSQFLDSKLEYKENPHVSFIKGVLPSLASFNDDENLEFQAGVLSLIQKIKKKRQDSM